MALTRFFASPLFLRGLGAVVMLVLLFTAVVFGMARLALSQGDYARAQLLPGSVADGASFYADALLRDGDTDGADLAARRALSASLANPRALRVLGQIRDAEKKDTAAALYSAGGLWTWRDTPTQLWLLVEKGKAGDAAGAFQHADALLRRNQQQLPMFTLLTRAAAVDPKSLAAMLPFFEGKPIWRGHFFDSTHQKELDPKGVQAIMFALAGTRAPPDEHEIRSAVVNLNARGAKAEAAAIWARFHPGEPLPAS